MTNDESMTNDEKAGRAARRIIVRASSFAVESRPKLSHKAMAWQATSLGMTRKVSTK